jgi:hypothetical protein
MLFIPPRARGLMLGGLLLLLLVGITAAGLYQLGSSPISPAIVIWVVMPLIGLPLALVVAYRLYGLLTARYRLDRDGFYLIWGPAMEQIPLSMVKSIEGAAGTRASLRPGMGLWWPGCVVGRVQSGDSGAVEFFATGLGDRLMLVKTDVGTLAVSPRDADAFNQAFVDATRMGSLEQIQAVHRRPDYFSSRMWNDRLARGLLLGGLILDLLLLGFLAVRAPTLGVSVPFGFGPGGVPGPMVPPGRLLLLPLIAGLCWLGDLVLGAWLYRRDREKLIAYAVWTSALIVGGLFWGATLQLMSIS